MRNLEVMPRSAVWEILHKRGIAQVIVHFSGGNDEGGVTEIIYIDKNGEKSPSREDGWSAVKWTNGKESINPRATEEEKLAYSLSKPVYDKYYSFAGDFYVDGTVIWNVDNQTVRMSGDEEVKSSRLFEKDV